jgi:hypothetical protein
VRPKVRPKCLGLHQGGCPLYWRLEGVPRDAGQTASDPVWLPVRIRNPVLYPLSYEGGAREM